MTQTCENDRADLSLTWRDFQKTHCASIYLFIFIFIFISIYIFIYHVHHLQSLQVSFFVKITSEKQNKTSKCSFQVQFCNQEAQSFIGRAQGIHDCQSSCFAVLRVLHTGWVCMRGTCQQSLVIQSLQINKTK